MIFGKPVVNKMLNSRASAGFNSGRRPFAFCWQSENLSHETGQIHPEPTVQFSQVPTKTASERGCSRKLLVSELERGRARTGSSSFPPQVDRIIGPFRTNQPDRSCCLTACAVEKGRKPVGQLEEQLLERLLLLVLAAELLQEQLLELHRRRLNHSLLSIQRQSIRRSIRQQSRNHNFAVPVLLHGERFGRSQPEHMSELIQRMGCSSTCYDEPGHQFRQQLHGELARPCRSDRRRKRS